MKCKWCKSDCIKSGRQQSGIQRFQCKHCKKYQQQLYKYNAYKAEIHELFIKFQRIGIPFRKLSGFLEISPTTVQKWILRARNITPGFNFPIYGTYDIDEIKTCATSKANEIWVCYGWNVDCKMPIGLNVGGRSKKDLLPVVDEVLNQIPLRVNTDGLQTYASLIPKHIHRIGKRKANHIERNHLNLRKDIAALARKTICLAKSSEMLEARLKWNFWGETNPYFFLQP